MPAYNASQTLPEAIASVQAQSLTSWELVIVNDGSVDETRKLLDQLTDARIKIIHQLNSGVSGARNKALDHAEGEYITFLDADDTLPPKALEVRASFLDANQDVDIVHGSVQCYSDHGRLHIYRPSLKRGPLFEPLARLNEGVFFNPNYMIRRSKLATARFPINISHCEDLIFFLELAHDAELRYAAVSDVIYEYRVQPNSAMSDMSGIESGYLELVRRSMFLSRITPMLLSAQVHRVRSILLKSWLRRMRPDRAVIALFKLQRLAWLGPKF